MKTNWDELKELSIEEMAKWLFEFIEENEVHPSEKWILDFLKKQSAEE